MDAKQYQKGYDDAVAAIKKAIAEAQQGGGGNGSQQQNNNLPMPKNLPQSKNDNKDGKSGKSGKNQQNQNNQGGQSGQDSQDQQDQQDQQGGNGRVSSTDFGNNQQSKKNNPTTGSVMTKDEGDKIAESEGYAKEGGNADNIEKEWKDASVKATSKMKGTQFGDLASKINKVFKTSTDWKKSFRKIIGSCISPDDKRQAYANKNILVSQNRIARTDKDKYDALASIICFVDSSGSMTDNMLRKVLSEVYTLALQKKPMKLVIIQCDTRITDIQEYTNIKDLQKQLSTATVKGRGGTELKPCWDLLIKEKKYTGAELVLVFTDGELTQYRRNPKTMKNLCWVILDNPEFQVQYKENKTMCIYLNTDDVK